MGRTRVHGRNGYVQCSKGNNSQNRQTRVMFHVFQHHLMVLYIAMKVRENISNGISYGADTKSGSADGLTDGQTYGHSKFRTV